MYQLSKLFIFILLVCLATEGFAQQKSKAQLEKEKKENLKKIQESSKILEETRSEKKASLGQLSAIQQQVAAQKKLIEGMNKELRILDGDIADITQTTKALEVDLKNLRKEYAAMVYAASKASHHDRLLFLFSASTFNQFLMRIKYLQQYAEARKEQVAQIETVKTTLLAQQTKLQTKRVEQTSLIAAQVAENKKLLAMQGEQNKLIGQLSQREKDLRKEIAAAEEANRVMEKLIADLIREEIRKTAKAAPAGTNTASNKITLTPETAMLSASFEGNKAKLIWPVSAGFISGKFGTHPHPLFKNVMTDNPGVLIQTNKGEKVRVVFDGEVGIVANIPGKSGRLVCIQHGEYITVYSGLKDVFITPGQKIKAKDFIGEVYTDKDGISEIQFQIWKNTERLNPQLWLYNK
jgi:murein hydrolase activator